MGQGFNKAQVVPVKVEGLAHDLNGARCRWVDKIGQPLEKGTGEAHGALILTNGLACQPVWPEPGGNHRSL